MSKSYDYKLAKRIIQMKSDILETALLGIEEDWFWTAEAVYDGGKFILDLDIEPEIAGLCGSTWGTPTILLTYKDGQEEFMSCFTGDSEGKRPDWFELGPLSAPCQDYVDSVKRPKLGLDI